jgi:hypothetical protein
MGIAQGVGDLLLLAEALLSRTDIGFLFIGRGSDLDLLRLEAKNRDLVNSVFCEEIDADEIPALYAQCHVGLIALDVRHTTHNIPGKFLSYINSGLPVLALINDGNDLKEIIEKYKVGEASTSRSMGCLVKLAESIIEEISVQDCNISLRCKRLGREIFSSKIAVQQIFRALSEIS